jgi:hypothetical protein
MTFLSPLDKSWERTAWCVPSAFAILTGCTLASAHSKFAFINQEAIEDVEGCWHQDLLIALMDAGKTCTPVDLHTRYPDMKYGPTLRRYMRERPMGEERMYPLLLRVPGHVLCAQMDYMADNWTTRPVPVENFPKLGRNVHQAWVIK